MAAAFSAFNIRTDAWESVPDVDDPVAYNAHKPRKPPFQNHTLRARWLWERTGGDMYLVWMQSNVRLMLRPTELPDPMTPPMLGDYIDEFRLDKARVAGLLKEQRAKILGPTSVPAASAASQTTTTTTVTTTHTTTTTVSHAESPDAVVQPKKKLKVVKKQPEAADSVGELPLAPATVSDQSLPVEADSGESGQVVGTADGGAAAVDDAADAAADDDEAAAMQGQLVALQQQVEDERTRADSAVEDAARARKTHETYKKTKQAEMKKKNAEIADAKAERDERPSKDAVSKMETELNAIKGAMPDDVYSSVLASRSNPRVCYDELLARTATMLDKAIANATAAGSSSTLLTDFELFDNGWNPISDPAVIQQLKICLSSGTKVTYSYNGLSYEAEPISKKNKDLGDIVQRNLSSKTERYIRDASNAKDAASVMKRVLFGADSFLDLDRKFVGDMLKTLRFDLDQTVDHSLKIAQLAEKFSALASKFVYAVPAGTVATAEIQYPPADPKAAPTSFKTHSDGTTDFNSELYVKPIALFNWLTLANARGYTSARLVMHGGSMDAYAGIRDDPLGFDMSKAGRHGQAFGNGLYFGLSDHATVGYNARSGLPVGSCVLGLLLTKDTVGWQHHHTGSHHFGYDEEAAKQYKTIMFSTPIPGVDNAIVVHESPIVLPLGLAWAFSHQDGWISSPTHYTIDHTVEA